MTTVPARTRLTREQSRQRTRAALIAAAMGVFARDGYAGAPVDAIAEQAGFTVGALYSNFATKQDLFLAVFEQHCAGELAALIHALWTGFMHYRLTSPEAVSADAFGRAVGWLLAGQQHDTKKGPKP